MSSEELNKDNKELMKDMLFSYASMGDIKSVKNLIEGKGVEVNSTKHNLTALSVCAAKSGDIEVIEYLLSRDAEIRDSHLHAIRAGNEETVQLLLSKLSKNREMSPIKESAVFAPYMTPLMLAAICGHRVLIELLMCRGHTMPIPHMAYCECDDCNVSTTGLSTPSQRNLDIYRALCNPTYIGLNSSDPIIKVFELERECRSVLENSSYFSNQYKTIFKKMETYIKDLIDVTRDAEEVKVLVIQKGVESRPNIFIKYWLLQKAIDHNWVEFVSSKRIESLRSHLWLGHNKVWFHSGIGGLTKKFLRIWLIILGQLVLGLALVFRYNKHITAQSRYLCRLFNESLFALVLLCFVAKNPINEKSVFNSIVKTFVIVWTFGNVINITKKCAIFGLKKLWRFYGHVFEFVITFELLFIIFLNFMCKEKDQKSSDSTIESSNRVQTQTSLNTSDQTMNISICVELKYILLRLLVKLIYVRLVLLSSLRAYKGSEEHTILRLTLLSFCLVSLVYAFFANTIASMYNISPFESSFGIHMFGETDPTLVFILCNFFIGLTFELLKGPEKISDKFWCYHWTARLIYEIHGACELAVPFNLLETHRVLYILLKRVGFKEKINEKEIEKHNRIKRLVYSRYDCIQYLSSQTSTDYNLCKLKATKSSEL